MGSLEAAFDHALTPIQEQQGASVPHESHDASEQPKQPTTVIERTSVVTNLLSNQTLAA